jgi:2-polyprenyl-3-methyl-5-hydroxy-6-metoxy-1,4-benzoquinol methylase
LQLGWIYTLVRLSGRGQMAESVTVVIPIWNRAASQVIYAARNLRRLLLRTRHSRRIYAQDGEVVASLKQEFIHGERELVHGGQRYSVDCLYCHAVPGTLETSILELIRFREEADDRKTSLLNLGGGSGQVSTVLERCGFAVTNVDIELGSENERNIRFNLNSCEPLPLAAGSFDLVLCQEVIEHVENPWQLLRQVWRLLREGGHLVLTTPNIQSKHSKKMFVKNGYFHWFTPECFEYHINAIPLWELRLIASRTGFRIDRIAGNGEYYFGGSAGLGVERSIEENECLIVSLTKA